MRKLIVSFLFFIFSLFSSGDVYCQVVIDSTTYYNRVIEDPRRSAELVSAYEFFRNLKGESLKTDDRESAIYYTIKLAVIEKELGDIHNSESSAIEALKLLDELEVSDWAAGARKSINNHLGILSSSQLNYPKAIEYYKKILASSKTFFEESGVLGNIGNIYAEEGNHKLAVINYKKALNIISDIKEEKLEARLLDLLGLSQSKIEETSGLDNMKKALKIRNRIDFPKGILSSNLHLSEYYSDINIKDSAIYYLSNAIKISDAIGNPRYKIEVLSKMIDQGDYSRVPEYKTLKDSLELAKQLNENKYAEAKYNYTKKEIQLKDSELKNERQKSKTLLAFAIASFIALTSIFLYFILKSKHKKEKIEQVFNTESRISKKIHDELANDISDTLNFIENKVQLPTEEKTGLLNSLEDIYIRTRDISTETASIDLEDFSGSLKNLMIQHNKENTKVVTNDIENIDWKSLPNHKKMTVYRSLQELMVNMKKHSKAKLVSIVFKRNGKHNEIYYKDDGIGVDLNNLKLNGLKNVESRIKTIGGTFSFDSSKGDGFKAILKFNS